MAISASCCCVKAEEAGHEKEDERGREGRQREATLDMTVTNCLVVIQIA